VVKVAARGRRANENIKRPLKDAVRSPVLLVHV
jgi:hypothetical protein